jgi:hypothetical protein
MHVSEPVVPVNAGTAHDATYDAPVLSVLGA